MSCSGPMLTCGRGGQPPISSSGTRASEALATAVTVFVTPGPAVTMTTPSVPVSSAWAWAMWTAAPSSRTSTMRMPSRAAWSQIGWICPPCRPKMRSMPRSARNLAIQAAQVRSPLAIMSFICFFPPHRPPVHRSVCRFEGNAGPFGRFKSRNSKIGRYPRKPVDIQGIAATMISPTASPAMYPRIGFMPSSGLTRPMAQAA